MTADSEISVVGSEDLENFLLGGFCPDSRGGSEQSSATTDVESMFKLVTRSRYRRTKLDGDAATDIGRKVSEAMGQGTPIEFAIPFGAYKHWLLPSYPLPDWAEVFNLKHLLEYAAPIAAAYPPGVVLNYTYTSGVMEKISNLPSDAQTKYLSALQALHAHFQEVARPGVRLRLVDIREAYTPGALEAELEQNFRDNVEKWVQKYPCEVRAKKEQSARNNLVLTGIEDLTRLQGTELEDRFRTSAMWCDALDSLSERRGFNKYGHCIQLVFIRGPSLSMHIGSCRGSNAHFWVGGGVVENRKGGLLETIVTARHLVGLLDDGTVERVRLNCKLPVPLDSLETALVMCQKKSPVS